MRPLLIFIFCCSFLSAYAQRSVKKKLEGSWQIKSSVNNGVRETYGDSGDVYTFFSNRDYQHISWLHPKNGGKDTLLIRQGYFDFYTDSDDPEKPLIELLFFGETDLYTGSLDNDEYEYRMIFIDDSTMLFTDRVEGVNDTMWLRRIPAKERVHKTSKTVSPKTLYGSWEIQQSAIPSQQGMLQRGCTLTLTPDQRYQLVNFILRYDTLAEHSRMDTVVETGLWTLSGNNQLILYNRIITDQAMPADSYEDEVELYVADVREESLTLYTQENGVPVNLRLKRIPQMKWFAVVQPVYFDRNKQPVTAVYARLVNSLDTTRKIELRSSVDITAACPPDTSCKKCTMYYSGSVMYATDTSLFFGTTREEREFTLRNGTEGSLSHSYSAASRTIELPVRTIQSLTYISPARLRAQTFFGTFAFCSFLSAVIVAPLASINYSHWTFNKQRYFTIAGIGLAGVVVGVPLASVFSEQNYLLTTKHGFKSKKYWYIEVF